VVDVQGANVPSRCDHSAVAVASQRGVTFVTSPHVRRRPHACLLICIAASTGLISSAYWRRQCDRLLRTVSETFPINAFSQVREQRPTRTPRPPTVTQNENDLLGAY